MPDADKHHRGTRAEQYFTMDRTVWLDVHLAQTGRVPPTFCPAAGWCAFPNLNDSAALLITTKRSVPRCQASRSGIRSTSILAAGQPRPCQLKHRSSELYTSDNHEIIKLVVLLGGTARY